MSSIQKKSKSVPFPWVKPAPNLLEVARYLALDPGETTGYCLFDEEGKEIWYGQFRLEKQTEALDCLIVPHLKAVITEDYKNHGWQQQKKWSRNQTSKNIGKIELMCELRGVPCILQPNTVKAIGYRWAGLDGPPSDHTISHQFDALAHGVYWTVKNNIRNPTISIPEEDK